MKADELGKYNSLVAQVNQHKDAMRALSDDDLRAKTGQFKARLEKGEKLDTLLPEAFAAVREAGYRVLGMFAYDNQVLAGIILHNGDIAAMKTGEGKSLAATMPLYLNALTGKGAILVTVNAYLAARDGNTLGEVYKYMGLSMEVGTPSAGTEDFTPEVKRNIYNSDIVYTTSDKLGFDYLLENITSSKEGKYLRPYHYVVIDEADSVLLDLAQMPLVISGTPRVQSNLYPLAHRFVATLRRGIEYEFDEGKGSASLTPAGMQAARTFFNVGSLYDPQYFKLNRHVNLALRAKELFLPMRDYMVIGGKVELLSPITGRLLAGNKLQGGLHQAIEGKEEVDISPENRAMASITYQNLFLMFEKMSGMTGTAKGSENELFKTYKTKVVEIPTLHPIIRKDDPDVIVKTIDEKRKLVLDYLDEVRKTGRPILLTTSSVKNSTILSGYLLERGISHNLLNALSEAKEAEIIKEAGQEGSITVATLMAGRGTDVKVPKAVQDLGGLAVIGTEKMPSRRIEEQVKGRAGRMGEPGSSRFYGSLEDDLFVKFGTIKQEDLARKDFSGSTMLRLINRAQRASEQQASDARDLSQKFDSAMIAQRDIVYGQRDTIIDGGSITDQMLADIASSVFNQVLAAEHDNKADYISRYILDNLTYRLGESFYDLDLEDNTKVKQFLMAIFNKELQSKKQALDAEQLYSQFQNLVFLKSIDAAWIEQVDFLEQLKTVVQDRSVAQHKVEYEYRKEAYYAFNQMKDCINREVVRLLCLSTIETSPDGGLVIQYA